MAEVVVQQSPDLRHVSVAAETEDVAIECGGLPAKDVSFQSPEIISKEVGKMGC